MATMNDLRDAIQAVLDSATHDGGDLDDIHSRGWCYLEIDSRELWILKKEFEIHFEEPD